MKDNTIKWLKAAGRRAIKTMAQAAVTLIGTDMVNIVSLDWKYILGACATMGALSICTSLAGLPELNGGECDE